MTQRKLLRLASLLGSLLSALVNTFFAFRLLALWRSLRWEVDTEWDASADAWRINPFKLMWALLCFYFICASTTSVLGFVGIAKRSARLLRFFRDYSIADLAFVTVSTVTLSYYAMRASYVRVTFCEEISRQPELMRGMAEGGLSISIENCEEWSEKATVVLLGLMFVILSVRLYFVIALTNYYKDLRRERHPQVQTHHRATRHTHSNSLHRIYLLPTPTSRSLPMSMSSSSSQSSFTTSKLHGSDVVVYAPIPVGGLSEQDARELHATEAWIPATGHRHSLSNSSSPRSPRSHRHHHHHHGSGRNSRSLHLPNEEKLIDVST